MYDNHAGAGEAFDQGGWRGNRRQGHDHHAGPGADQRRRVGFAKGTNPLRRMHALAARVDERSLDMDAERAGDVGLRLPRRRQRRVENLGRIGDRVGKSAVVP